MTDVVSDTPGVQSEGVSDQPGQQDVATTPPPPEATTTEPQAPPQLVPAPPEVFDWHTPDGQPGYSWTEVKQLAATMSESNLVPAVYRKKPQNVVVMAITGQELGWGIGTAMRFIHVIDSKPTISPEGMLALIRRAGHSVSGSSSSTSATVRGRRSDNGDEMECTFTIADATRAKLAGKDNWQLWPEAMLWARALAMLARRLFPDVLLGVAYVPDEMGVETDQWGNAMETSGREQGEPPPTWEELKWDKGKEHFDAAMRDTKRMMNLLDEDTKAKVRGLLGPPVPMTQYTLNVWAMRHAIVVAAARETGVIEENDDTTPNLTAMDAPNHAEGDPPPVPAGSPAAPGEPIETTATEVPEANAMAIADAEDLAWRQAALGLDIEPTLTDDDPDDLDGDEPEPDNDDPMGYG